MSGIYTEINKNIPSLYKQLVCKEYLEIVRDDKIKLINDIEAYAYKYIDSFFTPSQCTLYNVIDLKELISEKLFGDSEVILSAELVFHVLKGFDEVVMKSSKGKHDISYESKNNFYTAFLFAFNDYLIKITDRNYNSFMMATDPRYADYFAASPYVYNEIKNTCYSHFRK